MMSLKLELCSSLVAVVDAISLFGISFTLTSLCSSIKASASFSYGVKPNPPFTNSIFNIRLSPSPLVPQLVSSNNDVANKGYAFLNFDIIKILLLYWN